MTRTELLIQKVGSEIDQKERRKRQVYTEAINDLFNSDGFRSIGGTYQEASAIINKRADKLTRPEVKSFYFERLWLNIKRDYAANS